MKQNDLFFINDEAGKSLFIGSLFDCMILFFSLINEGARNLHLTEALQA